VTLSPLSTLHPSIRSDRRGWLCWSRSWSTRGRWVMSRNQQEFKNEKETPPSEHQEIFPSSQRSHCTDRRVLFRHSTFGLQPDTTQSIMEAWVLFSRRRSLSVLLELDHYLVSSSATRFRTGNNDCPRFADLKISGMVVPQLDPWAMSVTKSSHQCPFPASQSSSILLSFPPV